MHAEKKPLCQIVKKKEKKKKKKKERWHTVYHVQNNVYRVKVNAMWEIHINYLSFKLLFLSLLRLTCFLPDCDFWFTEKYLFKHFYWYLRHWYFCLTNTKHRQIPKKYLHLQALSAAFNPVSQSSSVDGVGSRVTEVDDNWTVSMTTEQTHTTVSEVKVELLHIILIFFW